MRWERQFSLAFLIPIYNYLLKPVFCSVATPRPMHHAIIVVHLLTQSEEKSSIMRLWKDHMTYHLPFLLNPLDVLVCDNHHSNISCASCAVVVLHSSFAFHILSAF